MSRDMDQRGYPPGGGSSNVGWMIFLLLLFILWSILQDWDCGYPFSRDTVPIREQKESAPPKDSFPVARAE